MARKCYSKLARESRTSASNSISAPFRRRVRRQLAAMRVSIAAICLPIAIFLGNIDPSCFGNLAHSGIEHSGI